MNRIWISLALAFQLLVLGWMIFERESVLRHGRILYLATQPVDPRDPFRGDYVRLDYELSRVASNDCRDSLLNWMAASTNYATRKTWKNRRIYAAVKIDERQVAHLQYVSDQRPAEGLFIRGRVAGLSPYQLMARYGIEAYFVEQNQGRPIEERRFRSDGIRIPLEMELALGGNGIAVLKGYRWSRLGIGLTVETNAMRRLKGVTVTLMNADDKPLAVLDRSGGGLFDLEADTTFGGSREEIRWVGRVEGSGGGEDDRVVVLGPGEKHQVRIDLTLPEWWVIQGTNAPRAAGEIGDFHRWRLIYTPPPESATAHLKDADLIWHGRLISPAFNGGRVD